MSEEVLKYFTRCYAELIGRGVVVEADAETVEWAKTVFQTARDPENRDTLVRHHTIGELGVEALRYVSSIAWHRCSCLGHIMELIDQPSDNDVWQRWIEFSFPEPVVPETLA